MNLSQLTQFAKSRAGVLAGVGALSAAGTALWVQKQARRAERDHPPSGRFLDVDNVRLHYVERGSGSPVVLLHGNAVSLEDFECSGLFERLAREHRVIAFDRPGFGHSTRPRDRAWTPGEQARALHLALQTLGITQAVVVGHSMGALVATALALDHPQDVARLVLLSGYYYPTLRADALLTAPVALPVFGDALRYTLAAVTGRLALKGAVKGMFAPRQVPADFFGTMSREMMLRPVQLRANAEDAAFMMPAASAIADRHGELRMPLAIFAGADDAVVDPHDHAARLHRDLPHSELFVIPATGHMVHYTVPDEIADAVDAESELAALSTY